MANEHFEGEKERIVYMTNNMDYMYQNLKNLHLEKGIQDVIAIEKDLNYSTEKFIKVLLRENFPGLEEIVSKYCNISGDSSGSEDDQSSQLSAVKKVNLGSLNTRILESVT